MRVGIAQRMRIWADRLDFDGAPKQTSWSFTIEDQVGVVFNQDKAGCPVWHYGNADFERANSESRWGGVDLEKPEWATVGYRTVGNEVLVLGSADISQSVLSRRMEGFDEFAPFSGKVPDFARVRNAKVPRWTVTVNCRMRTFVQVTGRDYQQAIGSMFGKAGRSG